MVVLLSTSQTLYLQLLTRHTELDSASAVMKRTLRHAELDSVSPKPKRSLSDKEYIFRNKPKIPPLGLEDFSSASTDPDTSSG